MEYDRNDTSLNYDCVYSLCDTEGAEAVWVTCYRGSGEVEEVDSSSGG